MTTTREAWRWAAWFGVLSGLGQALMVAAAYLTTDRLFFLSADVVWMAPAANAVVFTLVATALELLTRRLDRSTSADVRLAVLLFLLLLGPLLIVPRLHPYAKVILGAGLALQGARVMRSRAGLLDVTIRRTLPWLVGLVVALGLGLHLSQRMAERRMEASLPAAAPGAPNVILIVLDTVRAQSLSLYGYQRQTSPRLDTFARTGVVFDRAFSPSPWTLPAHSSIFTGRLPHELSADWLTPLDRTHPTLAEAFASRGYMTVGFTANLLYTTASTGLSRGFVRYRDFPISPGALISHSWVALAMVAPFRARFSEGGKVVRKDAADVSEQFTTWIASRPQRPFFAFLNYLDAHEPYISPAPFRTKFGPASRVPGLMMARRWSQQEAQFLKDAQDGAMAYLDQQLGELFETLKQQGLMDNTLIVVTADHGEQFGEHGLVSHANSLYLPLLHVPLVISFPQRVPSGLRVSEPVTLVDLPATILDLVDIPTGVSLPGNSLAGFWRGSVRPGRFPLLAEITQGINLPPSQPASKGSMQSVVLGDMHYIRNGDGSEELYNFERDVAETMNLVGRPETSPVLDEARRAIALALTRR